MKKRLRELFIWFLVSTILTNGLVFSRQARETSEIFYNNIKIYTNGLKPLSKDANVNMIEPFAIITTYLPVCSVAEVFGKTFVGKQIHKAFISVKKAIQNLIIILTEFCIKVLSEVTAKTVLQK